MRLLFPLTLLCSTLSIQAQVTPPVTRPDSSQATGDGSTKSDPGVKSDGGIKNEGPAPGLPPGKFEEGHGNSWFEKTRIHLGTFFEEEEATGTFKFKNPNKEEKRIVDLRASCTCSSARIRVGDRLYSLGNDPVNNAIHRLTIKDGLEQKERVTFITLNPDEEGSIEVHMKMAGHQGEKDANLQVTTSDEKLPAINLQWRALGAVYFLVEPPDINLNEMTWKDHRQFTFQVTSPLQPDFNLTAINKQPAKSEVKYEKSLRDGKAVWKVTGTYGPNLTEKDGGGEIEFATDARAKPVKMRFAAFVRGPIKMTPGGFFSFGPIRQGTEGKQLIHLWPTDDFQLEVQKVEFTWDNDASSKFKPENMHVKTSKGVKFKDPDTREEKSNVAQVELVIAPDTEKSVVRGKVRIFTNHPQVPMHELMFNGFVR